MNEEPITEINCTQDVSIDSNEATGPWGSLRKLIDKHVLLIRREVLTDCHDSMEHRSCGHTAYCKVHTSRVTCNGIVNLDSIAILLGPRNAPPSHTTFYSTNAQPIPIHCRLHIMFSQCQQPKISSFSSTYEVQSIDDQQKKPFAYLSREQLS